MCGIAGYIGKKPLDANAEMRTLEKMKNRGPDFSGAWHFSVGASRIVLLHSRLSIIDLDDRANQPFLRDGYTLVFNGEIYNFVELRERLKKRGAVFTTQSDTEVLLQAYLMDGESCVESFEGMWAFALYDPKRKGVFLSRDRFGEKPLYLLHKEDGFFFGSETRFLQALSGRQLEVNSRHLLRYMVNGYKSLYKVKDTFLKEVCEVPPGTSCFIDLQLRKTSNCYWKPDFSPRAMTFEQAVEGFRAALFESVRLRLRSDVPLAFCLSGGVDSAALASIAAKEFRYHVATFSIVDQDERYNEYPNIKATIDDLGCKHSLIHIGKTGTLEKLKRLIAYHDAPIYTVSYYVHSLLSEAISREGYRVAISGTGADEMLTGYYDHFNLHLALMRRHSSYGQLKKDWEVHTGCFVRNPFLKNPDLFVDNPAFRDHIFLNREEFGALMLDGFDEPFTETVYCSAPLRNRMLNELLHESVPVILHEDDLNSMCYSIENRSPYLDSKLFQFAYSIPDEHLIRDGYGKIVLREAVRGILNDQVRLDRQKKGFNASLLSLVDLGAQDIRSYILDSSPIYDFVDRRKIEGLLDVSPMPNSLNKFLFYLINAKIFLEQHQGALTEAS